MRIVFAWLEGRARGNLLDISMKAYKLTDENGQTRNKTQWYPGVSHTAFGSCADLCSNGWIHFYTSPFIAVIMNPIHAKFNRPKLWECATSGEEVHEPLKSGCKTLTTIREIPLPKITTTQKIVFGILCVKEVYKEGKRWNEWADKWLSGEDRSKDAASNAAYYAAMAAIEDPSHSCSAYAASNAAYYAAMAAIEDPSHSCSAYAAYPNSAAYAAYYATTDAPCEKTDWHSLAEKALTYE